MNHSAVKQAAWVFLVLHVAITLFGLVGIVFMIPNPDIWNGSPLLVALFPPSVQWGGNLQIVLGAAALVAYGVCIFGLRPTLIFFIASVIVSLTFELMGTMTGFPFGDYAYTQMFGPKIVNEVPPAIPLSWFYMGLSSFVLAKVIVKRWIGGDGIVVAVLLGAIILTIWDLVLDPAMAHETISLKYWVWDDTGPYMGIPLANFLGWIVTGVIFMGIASFADRRLVSVDVTSSGLPLTLYSVNMLFAIGICAGASLWLPVVVGLALLALIVLAVTGPILTTLGVRRKA